jgi:hypothetical protein
MHSSGTNGGPKTRLNIPDVGPRFGSTKLAAAAIRGFSWIEAWVIARYRHPSKESKRVL